MLQSCRCVVLPVLCSFCPNLVRKRRPLVRRSHDQRFVVSFAFFLKTVFPFAAFAHGEDIC